MRAPAMVLALALVVPAIASAVGCSSSSSSSASAPSGDDAGAGDDGAANPHQTTVSFEMKVHVPAGGEMFKCQYVQLPAFQGYLVAGTHSYTPGSHHLLMFPTDLTAIPAGGDQVTDCYEGTGNDIMSHARGILYGGQTPQGSMELPPNIGLRTAAAGVLIFQVHYLNAGATDLDATVDVNLTIDDGTDVTTQAGTLFYYDPFIDVPAGATAKATTRCLIPSDITLLSASSHYHARGVGYSATIDPGATTLGQQPFYTSNSWNSPDQAKLSMPIPAGSRLRFECDYDNTMGTQEYFQGQSAQTNEMCMFIGIYYPEMGQLSDFCVQGRDMFGTGTATCNDSLTCLQNCPAGMGMGSGAGGGIGGAVGAAQISDCQQKCFVDSCPTAGAPLFDFVTCLQSSCSSDCATAGSSTCSSCIQQKCAAQYLSCSSQKCN